MYMLMHTYLGDQLGDSEYEIDMSVLIYLLCQENRHQESNTTACQTERHNIDISRVAWIWHIRCAWIRHQRS